MIAPESKFKQRRKEVPELSSGATVISGGQGEKQEPIKETEKEQPEK